MNGFSEKRRLVERSRGFLIMVVVIGAAAVLASAAAGGVARSAVKPSNSSRPVISGTVQEGSTLTASTGNWNGSTTITFQYQWRRCGPSGGNCGDISGETAQTYVVGSIDIGNTLRVRVIASNADGSSSSTSLPTTKVNAATTTTTQKTTTTTPSSPGCSTTGGTVPIADVTSPAHLDIDQFQVTPSTITYATRSLTVRFHVTACGGSVQGALIYVTAIPYGMFSIPNEQVTGSDGWATLDFTGLPGFPVSRHQELLVMFVRARKSGEDILGGISARRLVSFKVSGG